MYLGMRQSMPTARGTRFYGDGIPPVQTDRQTVTDETATPYTTPHADRSEETQRQSTTETYGSNIGEPPS